MALTLEQCDIFGTAQSADPSERGYMTEGDARGSVIFNPHHRPINEIRGPGHLAHAIDVCNLLAQAYRDGYRQAQDDAHKSIDTIKTHA